MLDALVNNKVWRYDGKVEPLPVLKKKDDYRLFDYDVPSWEKKNSADQSSYSEFARSKIKDLPKSTYLRWDVLEPKADQILAFVLRRDPESANHLPWLLAWFLDEVPAERKDNYSEQEELRFQIALGFMLSPGEVMQYCVSVSNAIDNLPDEVSWKKDFEREQNEFFFVWMFEKTTFNLYYFTSDIQRFENNPTPDLALSISGTLAAAARMDSLFGICERLPKSRFAVLFPVCRQKAAEVIKDSDMIKWEKENKDKVIGEDHGKNVTVGDAFDMIRHVLEEYDSGSKKEEKDQSDSSIKLEEN